MKTKLIFAGGVMSILLGLYHCMFWKGLDWAAELPKLSAMNSAVMQMFNLGIICLLLCLGVILIVYRSEVARTRTGRALLLTMTMFYIVRLAGEFIFIGGGDVWLVAILIVYILVYLIPALMGDLARASSSG